MNHLWRLAVVALTVALLLLSQRNGQLLSAQRKQALSGHVTPVTLATAPLAGSPVAQPVTLRWFMRWDQARVERVARPLIAAFEAAHPEIKLELETIEDSSTYYRTLALQLDQGTPPDLFYPATHVAYALALRQQLLPLDRAHTGTDLDLSAYDPALLALYREDDGPLYCLPADIATLVVVYNKRLFDQANLPYPTAEWDWAAFAATAQALTKTSSDPAATVYGVDRFYDYWPLLIWSWSGHNLFDNPQQPTRLLLDDDTSVEALTWLATLAQQGSIPPYDSSEANEGDLFLQERAAMQITGHWRLSSYQAANLAFDVAPLPQGNFLVNRGDGSCFAIPRESPHAAAAWTFVNWLAGPTGEGATLLSQLQPFMTPARRDLQQGAARRQATVRPELNLTPFQPGDAQRFGLYDPLHPMQARWQAAAEDPLAELWRGETAAEAVVETLVEEADEILENLALASAPDESADDAEEGAAEGAAAAKPLTMTLPLADREAATLVPTPAVQQAISQALTARSSPLRLPRYYYVDPAGSDDADGLSPAAPFATLQRALAAVAPGDTIYLAPGDYRENVTSVVAGESTAPITIMGPPTAVLRGAGEASAAFYLTHSNYSLIGFTIDGLYGDPQAKEGYTEKLLYVQGKGEKTGVTGLRVLNMTFRNAGGECLRLRYFAQHNEIAYSTFTTCGLLDFEFADGGKNGEAIYVGTATDQWADGKNPTADPDETSYNWIHHNVMNTQGNECVEIKEGGYNNLIEYNRCTGQLDPESAGIGARGSANLIRYNLIYGNVGAGIRLGGHTIDAIAYGINNQVYGNAILENVAGGINITVEPQGQICDNHLEGNLGKVVFGDEGEAYLPTQACD